MDESITKVIVRAVEDAERYPFLFVGSGISLRYMGSPNWAGLLDALCGQILHDRYAFARYRALASTAKQNGKTVSELPYVSTLMEDEVNLSLLGGEEFSWFREKYDAELRNGQSPMKTYIADLLKGYHLIRSAETDLLSQAGREKVSGIITTNYDNACETLFPSFKVYASEGDLLFSEPSFAQEIYKIHGSVSCPDRLIVTEGDYSDFSSKRKYLAAKLLTIFAEYPVVFLGYSIQDENIKAILADICECVPPNQLQRLHDRMVFVEHGSSTYIADHTMDLNGRLLSMTRITTDDFASIYEGLLQTKRLYSPRLIRELKNNVFKLAERIDPTSEIVTSGFDSLLERLSPNQSVAISIAVSSDAIGKPITAEDIYQDVLLDDLGMDHRFIVDNYLNTLVQRLSGAVPFFKYIVDLEGGVGKAIARHQANLTSLGSFRSKSNKKSMVAVRRRFNGVSGVRELALACAPKLPYVFIPSLPDERIDVDELGVLLKTAISETREGSEERRDLLKNSDFRKCVRIYDFLRYAPKQAEIGSPPTFTFGSEDSNQT